MRIRNATIIVEEECKNLKMGVYTTGGSGLTVQEIQGQTRRGECYVGGTVIRESYHFASRYRAWCFGIRSGSSKILSMSVVSFVSLRRVCWLTSNPAQTRHLDEPALSPPPHCDPALAPDLCCSVGSALAVRVACCSGLRVIRSCRLWIRGFVVVRRCP